MVAERVGDAAHGVRAPAERVGAAATATADPAAAQLLEPTLPASAPLGDEAAARRAGVVVVEDGLGTATSVATTAAAAVAIVLAVAGCVMSMTAMAVGAGAGAGGLPGCGVVLL